MPCITIKSLPLVRQIDLKETVEGLCSDFAKANDMSIEVVSLAWDFFLPDCYAYHGISAQSQSDTTHPLMVEIYAPDLYQTNGSVSRMMTTLAESIELRTGISKSNVFIRFSGASRGEVFEAGEVVMW